jgi:homospermidine synthase
MTDSEKWILGCTIVMALGTICAVVVSIVALSRKQEVKVEQPVTITITEELHKIFAGREVFEKHVAENREDHADIFKKIGGVERGAASTIDQRVEVVRRDLVQVGQQVSGLQSETKLQNQQLARMDAKLDRLTERK